MNTPQPATPSLLLRHTSLLALLLTGAALVGLVGASAPPLWFDEAWSAYAAAQPSLLAAARADATNPPLYYLLLHLSARATGTSELALRAFSWWAGLLTVALLARVAGASAGAAAARWAVLLLAASAPWAWATREVRMYTVLALGVLLAAAAWAALRQGRRQRAAWVVLLAAELALLYAHNTGPVVVAWLNTVTLLSWLHHAARRQPWRTWTPAILPWLAGQALVLGLYAPYAATLFADVLAANAALTRTTPLGWPLWASLWAAPWPLLNQPGWATLIAALAAALGLCWAAAVLRGASRWWALHTLVLLFGLWAALNLLGNPFHARYLVMVVPLALLPAATTSLRVARWGVFALSATLLVVFATASRTVPAAQRDDPRAMARLLADALGPGDTVLMWSYADRYDLATYWPRARVTAARVTLPEGAGHAAVVPHLPRAGRVGVNVWYTQRADYRGMVPCLLAHGSTAPPTTLTVNGMSTLLYDRPPAAYPAFAPATIDTAVGQVSALGTLPTTFDASQALCLPVRLALAAPAHGELKVALVAQNALGQVIAQADAVFATADQRTSADIAPHAQPGTTLEAYPHLRLPYGTPGGAYALALRIYDDRATTGYDVLRDGVPTGKDAPLGPWRVAGAAWPPTDAPGLPHTTAHTLPDGTRLLAHDAASLTRAPGEAFLITLLWERPAGRPLPELALSGASIPAPLEDAAARAEGGVLRDWRQARVPSDASDDTTLDLTLPDGIVLATITVRGAPLSTEAPPLAVALAPDAAAYDRAGALLGLTALPPSASVAAGSLPLTLVWRAAADAPPPDDVVVFIQLLDANGTLVAQSDAVPANGTRPLTGWRPGEIILDAHTLVFNAHAAPGPATLIAGLYRPDGRLRTRAGADVVTLGTLTLTR